MRSYRMRLEEAVECLLEVEVDKEGREAKKNALALHKNLFNRFIMAGMRCNQKSSEYSSISKRIRE